VAAVRFSEIKTNALQKHYFKKKRSITGTFIAFLYDLKAKE